MVFWINHSWSLADCWMPNSVIPSPLLVLYSVVAGWGGVSLMYSYWQSNSHACNLSFMVAVLSSIYRRCDANINTRITTASKHNIVFKLEVTLYLVWCLHLFLCSLFTPPTPPHHHPPLSLHLLLSNCSRNHSFISITCRKPAQPKITPNSPPGFSLSPHFSCAFFPWVTFAVTVFIPEMSFTHMPPRLLIYSVSKTTSLS